MWLINNNYGTITPEMVQQWRTTHFFHDMGGTRHDTLVYTDGKTYPTYLNPWSRNRHHGAAGGRAAALCSRERRRRRAVQSAGGRLLLVRESLTLK